MTGLSDEQLAEIREWVLSRGRTCGATTVVLDIDVAAALLAEVDRLHARELRIRERMASWRDATGSRQAFAVLDASLALFDVDPEGRDER